MWPGAFHAAKASAGATGITGTATSAAGITGAATGSIIGTFAETLSETAVANETDDYVTDVDEADGYGTGADEADDGKDADLSPEGAADLGELSGTAPAANITDSPSFRQAIAVNEDENDVSVYPQTSPEGIYDSSDLPDFDADAYILIERRTGQTICSKNAEMRLYPASITKIMTGILAIETGDMDTLMTASVRAVRDIGPDGSNIGIIAGEKMRLDNLLDALLVRSANETANIIAENLCETREDFISLMNAKAKELGAYNTNFTNASGIHETTHYSTAYDLAKIANYAMDNARFREIVKQRNIILAPTNKHTSWDRMNSTNNLLVDDSISGFAVTGVKTGYHSQSGYCVVASGVDNNNMELLCVVLGVRGTVAGTSAKRFQIAAELLSYGFENYEMCTFIRDNELIGTISVLGGENLDTVDAMSDGTVRLFMPGDQQKWNISRIEYIKSEIIAPVEQGETLGYVEFRNDGIFSGRVNLVASSDIPALKGGIREIPNRGDTGSARSPIFKAGDAAGDYAAGGSADNAANVFADVGADGGYPEPENDARENSAGTGAGAGRFASFNNRTETAETAETADSANNAGPVNTFSNRINILDILKTLMLIIIILAALISVLRTVYAIQRNNRRNRTEKYRGNIDYPPVRGKYRRVRNKNAREQIKYDTPMAHAPSIRRGYRENAPERGRGKGYGYLN